MERHQELQAHVYRLLHVVRSAEMQRALVSVNTEPALNFWRLIYGNQLDIAVLEWCKIFGSDGEDTHWKKIVPANKQDRFRNEMFTECNITAEKWGNYWQNMKNYRDNLVAHHIEKNKVANYPELNIALQSSFFYYKYLINELNLSGVNHYPSSLSDYSEKFRKQAQEIAKIAIASTSKIKECVD